MAGLTHHTYANHPDPEPIVLNGFPVGTCFPAEYLQLPGGMRVVYHRRTFAKQPGEVEAIVTGAFVSEQTVDGVTQLTVEEIVDGTTEQAVREALRATGLKDYIGFDLASHQ